jgi:surfeit locus 1 family protein
MFRFEPWPTLVVALLLPLLLALGAWQLERADEKRALLDAAAAAAAAEPIAYAADLPRYAKVRVAGRWDARQFLLDAQVQRGQAGYRVLTPLTLADGKRLIVDRGWVAAGVDRAVLPMLALPEGEVAAGLELEGQLDEFPRPGLRTGAAPAGTGWPRVLLYPTAATIADALGSAVEPRLLRLGEVEVAVGFPPERHLGYAVTWFALAATLSMLWLAFSARKRDAEEA